MSFLVGLRFSGTIGSIAPALVGASSDSSVLNNSNPKLDVSNSNVNMDSQEGNINEASVAQQQPQDLQQDQQNPQANQGNPAQVVNSTNTSVNPQQQLAENPQIAGSKAQVVAVAPPASPVSSQNVSQTNVQQAQTSSVSMQSQSNSESYNVVATNTQKESTNSIPTSSSKVQNVSGVAKKNSQQTNKKVSKRIS